MMDHLPNLKRTPNKPASPERAARLFTPVPPPKAPAPAKKPSKKK